METSLHAAELIFDVFDWSETKLRLYNKGMIRATNTPIWVCVKLMFYPCLDRHDSCVAARFMSAKYFLIIGLCDNI